MLLARWLAAVLAGVEAFGVYQAGDTWSVGYMAEFYLCNVHSCTHRPPEKGWWLVEQDELARAALESGIRAAIELTVLAEDCVPAGCKVVVTDVKKEADPHYLGVYFDIHGLRSEDAATNLLHMEVDHKFNSSVDYHDTGPVYESCEKLNQAFRKADLMDWHAEFHPYHHHPEGSNWEAGEGPNPGVIMGASGMVLAVLVGGYNNLKKRYESGSFGAAGQEAARQEATGQEAARQEAAGAGGSQGGEEDGPIQNNRWRWR